MIVLLVIAAIGFLLLCALLGYFIGGSGGFR